MIFLRYVTILAAVLIGYAMPVSASVIPVTSFVSPTVIDFNDGNPVNTQLGATYAAQGIASTNLCGGQIFQTSAAAASETASNFFAPGCDNGTYGPKEIVFGSTMIRVGFDITTNPNDDTTVTAYLGSTLVGSELFDTFGAGGGGSFAGIEFLSGFNRIVISAAQNTNGAFSIDNLRFEGRVPEPTSLALFGLGLAGLWFGRSRKLHAIS